MVRDQPASTNKSTDLALHETVDNSIGVGGRPRQTGYRRLHEDSKEGKKKLRQKDEDAESQHRLLLGRRLTHGLQKFVADALLLVPILSLLWLSELVDENNIVSLRHCQPVGMRIGGLGRAGG